MAARTYRLILDGELSDRMGLALPGMTITRGAGTTTLVGLVRDQAEFQGLLQRICGLGVTLLEAKAIDDPPAAPAPRDTGQRRYGTGHPEASS